MTAAVRPAQAGDAAAVATLARALAVFQGDPQRCRPEHIEAFFLRPGAVGLLRVAERGGALVGYAGALPAFDTPWAERGRYVADLFVAPEHRRRGVGRALLAALAAAVRAEGGSYLWWVAKPFNREAHAFYRGLGCREDELRAFVLPADAFERLAAEAGT